MMPNDRVFKVLIVAENRPELHQLARMLCDEGLIVVECYSAAEAIELFKQNHIGVVVIDLQLPDPGCLNLIEHIHSVDDRIRVIIYTKGASDDLLKEVFSGNDFSCVEKLSSAEKLIRHIYFACLEHNDQNALALEQAITERTAQLAKSNRELEEFAAVVAHDLRSPLLTISGYCQLLQEEYGDKLEDAANDYLSQIIAGAARMNRLIEDLLEYSRAAHTRQAPQKVEVASVIAQAIANLDAAIRRNEAIFEIGEMPTIVADATQLTQLFQNLFDNAIKFRSEQPPVIKVNAAHKQSAWWFSVSDNGIGIAPEYFGRIFQTFQRLHGQEYPGSGIGLAVCKKIVERHGGRIWLDSTVGRGTTFYFTIADRTLNNG